MASNRLPFFQLDVVDYLNDPAVMSMSAEAEGCYIRLLCRMWQSPTPGSVASNLVPEMCGLHRVCPEDRGPVLAELEEAFEVSGCGAFWTQKRMRTEWRRAQEVTKSRRKGAAITNASRTTSDAKRTPSVPLSARRPGGNGEGDGEEERDEPRTPVRLQRTSASVAEHEHFPTWYALYPIHKARRAAARAYTSALRRGATTAQLEAGAKTYAQECHDAARPPDKIKHPATWLNADSWLDEHTPQRPPTTPQANGKPHDNAPTHGMPAFTPEELTPPTEETKQKVRSMVSQLVAKLGS